MNKRWLLIGKLLIVVIINYILQGVSFAAPSITSLSTSSLTHGQPLTITGAGFGTKSSATPLRWDDFEAGANGAILSSSKWDTYTAYDNREPKYSNVIRRTGSSMSARCDFTNANYNSSFGIADKLGGLTSVYLDGWVYYDASPPYSRNFKLWRNYYWSGGTPNFYANLYCSNTDNTIHITQDGGGTSDWWVDNYGSVFFGRSWKHVQAYLIQSGAGQANGTVKVWIDGKLVVNSTNANTRGSGENAWDTIWVGNYLGHDAVGECPSFGNANVYWDDVYIDTTQSRVEIGDNPVYSNCTHREIQVPTNWTTTSINITGNVGSFASLTNAYLFIVDAAGNVNSQGFSITIGGPPSNDPPPAPSNLHVN